MQPGSETKAEIEARARAEGTIAEQLRQHDTRLAANHDSVAVLRERVASQDTAIKVIATELKEMRDDVGDLSGRIDLLSRNFWVAASAMTALMLSVVGLIVTTLASG